MGTCLSATLAPTVPILGSVHDRQLALKVWGLRHPAR